MVKFACGFFAVMTLLLLALPAIAAAAEPTKSLQATTYKTLDSVMLSQAVSAAKGSALFAEYVHDSYFVPATKAECVTQKTTVANGSYDKYVCMYSRIYEEKDSLRLLAKDSLFSAGVDVVLVPQRARIVPVEGGFGYAIHRCVVVDGKEDCSQTWFNDTWLLRQPFSVNHSQPVTVSDLDFCFSFDHATLVSAGTSLASAYDLRIADSAGYVLPHFVENGTENTANTTICTRNSTLATGNVSGFYLYYDNAAAANVENPAGVLSQWAAAYMYGNGTDVLGNYSLVDVTEKIADVWGIYGRARNVTASYGLAKGNASQPCNLTTQNCVITAWVKPYANSGFDGAHQYVYGQEGADASVYRNYIFGDSGTCFFTRIQARNGVNLLQSSSTAAPVICGLDTWNYVVFGRYQNATQFSGNNSNIEYNSVLVGGGTEFNTAGSMLFTSIYPSTGASADYRAKTAMDNIMVSRNATDRYFLQAHGNVVVWLGAEESAPWVDVLLGTPDDGSVTPDQTRTFFAYLLASGNVTGSNTSIWFQNGTLFAVVSNATAIYNNTYAALGTSPVLPNFEGYIWDAYVQTTDSAAWNGTNRTFNRTDNIPLTVAFACPASVSNGTVEPFNLTATDDVLLTGWDLWGNLSGSFAYDRSNNTPLLNNTLNSRNNNFSGYAAGAYNFGGFINDSAPQRGSILPDCMVQVVASTSTTSVATTTTIMPATDLLLNISRECTDSRTLREIYNLTNQTTHAVISSNVTFETCYCQDGICIDAPYVPFFICLLAIVGLVLLYVVLKSSGLR